MRAFILGVWWWLQKTIADWHARRNNRQLAQCSEVLKTRNDNSYRCQKRAGHDGRHEAPYGHDLKVFWPFNLEEEQ